MQDVLWSFNSEHLEVLVFFWVKKKKLSWKMKSIFANNLFEPSPTCTQHTDTITPFGCPGQDLTCAILDWLVEWKKWWWQRKMWLLSEPRVALSSFQKEF